MASSFRWFPEVQNIFYQGNKRKQVPSNQDQEKLESFFNCAATLMTDNLQQLALLSLQDYQDLLVQPPVWRYSLIQTSMHRTGERMSILVNCLREACPGTVLLSTLMEIKGFSQCIAANKQQACRLAAAASCGMVAACEFFVCKLVLLLLVAATLRLLVASTLQLIVAATLQLLVAATLGLIFCCNLAACAFFVCKLDFSFLVAACLLQTVAACLLQTAAACLLQTAAASLLQTVAVI